MTSLFIGSVAAESITYGDADLDGEITMGDVVIMQKHIAKLIKLKPAALMMADVDEEYGDINLVDVTCVQKYIAKIIDTFPVESYYENENDNQGDTESDPDIYESDIITSDSIDTELETLTLAQARELGKDAYVKIRGQVVYVYGNNTIILEEINDGKVVSYQIFDKEGTVSGKYPLNSIVDVTGTTSLYLSSLQISNPEKVELVSTDNKEIPPVEVEISDLSGYLSTKVILKNVKVTSYSSGILTVSKGNASVDCYRPADFPSDVNLGSTIDLICVPYQYDSKVMLRVAYRSDYRLISNADSDNTTDGLPTDTESNTDTSTESDTEFSYNGGYTFFKCDSFNISDLTALGYLIITDNNFYSLGGYAQDNSLSALEFLHDSTDGYALAESQCAYTLEGNGEGKYYLKNAYNKMYICSNRDDYTTLFTNQPLNPLSITATGDGTVHIRDSITGKYLGLKRSDKYGYVFRWYTSKSNALNAAIFVQCD